MTAKLISTLGIKPRRNCRKNNVLSERGVTLIETMVASLILMIVIAGLLPVFTLGLQVTEQSGDLATRTTEYAQDKMESLLKLDFNDGATDTTVFPPNAVGGTGLGGAMAANSTVGSVPPAAAVSQYVDYIDFNGNLLTSSTGAYYTRRWSISTGSTTTLKTITVAGTSLQVGGIKGLAPSTTLVSIKSSGL